MRFSLIDRIVSLRPGEELVAIKNLTLAEEYLGDHFPRFPVMPGVLMLEAMTQAAAWLVRVTDDFQHTMVVLREARGVKYGQFVEPGQTLTVTVKVTNHDARFTTVRAQGRLEDRTTVGARLTLERYNLADLDDSPGNRALDASLKDDLLKLFHILCPQEVAESAGVAIG
ncbi:MAG: beta-hydroxyacyl-ACP dehydratase [Planctomycetota bacterium]|nr:MAG: beta-hydroxyacyl-ACP dehydratase [Planctomycetota bacterium]